MRTVDGCTSRGITLKIAISLVILLIPFLLSGLSVSQTVSNNDLSWKEYASSSGNSYIVAGDFRYFDVQLDREVEKLSIVAYNGDSLESLEDRSVCNYYRWEYENGVWKDTSGHDSEYIKSSKCFIKNNTYSFYIGLDKKANQGSWKVIIHVDDEKIESTFSFEVVSHFNVFLLSLIGIYESNLRDKGSRIDIDFIISDQKRILSESKLSVEDKVDDILNKKRTVNDNEALSKDSKDNYIFSKTPPIKDEVEKITISTHPKSRLKNENSFLKRSFIFNKKVGGGNDFSPAKFLSYRKIFALILSIILLSIALVPAITTQDTTSSSDLEITSFSIFPENVKIEGSILLNVTASDPIGIKTVNANIADLELINLSFVEGDVVNSTIYSGLWQGNWFVNDIDSGDYLVTISVENNLNVSVTHGRTFTVLPLLDMNTSDNISSEPQMIIENNTSQSNNQTNEISNNSNITIQDEIQNNSFSQNLTHLNDQQITNENVSESLTNEIVCNNINDFFIYNNKPENSFGIPSVKEINPISFWQLFEEKSGWSLESYDSINNNWTNIDSYLTVENVRSQDNISEKVSLNFIAPSTTDYQLTYSIDLPVKSCVNNSENYEYILVYQVNETEDYTIFYNWSDMISIPEPLIFKHGMKSIGGEDYLNFRVMTGDINNPGDDIIAGTDVLLDPTFGYTGTGSSGQDGDDIPGGYFQMSAISGAADSISAYFITAGGANNGRAAIYDSSGNLLTNGVTDENTAVGDGWITFTYTTSPTLQANAYYYLVVFVNNRKSELQSTATGGGGLYIDAGETYPNFPDPYAATVIDSNYLVSIYCTYTEIDNSPPTPDPMTWSTEPYNVSSSSITMIATTASDTTLPISYYFNETTGNSGGTDGTWQAGTTYTDSDLSENTQYGYEVKARDSYGTPNEGNYSTPISYEYTSVDPPIDGELSLVIGESWINATVAQPPNPTSGSTGSYFNWVTGGAANSGWLSGVYFHNRTSLTENTNYGSQVRYRNADAEETSYNPTEKTNYTLLNPPTNEELTLTSGVTWVNATVVSPTNPTTGSTGSYFNWVTGGAANSGWLTDVYYHNRSSLTENTNYGSQVRYRNAESEETSYNPTEKTKYSLCNPPTDGEFTIDGHGVNWINMSITHPTNPFSGSTAAYFECVTGGGLDSGWTTSSASGRYYYNASGLVGGTTYGFRVKYRNGEGIQTSYTSEKQDTTDVGAALPTVVTNGTIGVEETNVTLRGWLQNNGTADTTCYFLWDTSSPPTASNVTQGVIANGADFYYDTSGTGPLTEGTLYYFDTKAVNSKGWDESGDENQFLTKPDPLTGFTATVISNTSIDLSWTDGNGGDGAYIEYSTNSPPSPWNEGDGTPIDADGNVTTPFSHTSLVPGTHYYYKAWAYASDGGWTSNGYSNAPRGDSPQTADGIVPAVPIVVTNDSIGVEETNATLRGYLQYNGSVDTECYFLWGVQNPPADNNVSQGITGNNTEFGYDTSLTGPLIKGTLYYFDTKANNSGGWDESGGVKTFLTKPDKPNSLTAQANTSTSNIYLTWNNGTGANNTYIERNTSSNWLRGEGIEVYNGSGTNYEDKELPEGVTYYYRAWSYVNWTYDSTTLYQWSDINVSTSNTTNVIPTISNEVPANEGTGISVMPQMSITVNHAEGDSMIITWYSNSSDSWQIFGTNITGVYGNGTYYQTNNNFSNYSKTYYWNVSVSDGSDINISDTFHFTTESIATSVDTISPYYVKTSGSKTITATGDPVLDDVTLYYRWSKDNQSWDSWDILTYDGFEGAVFDWGNYSDGGVDCNEYTGGTYAYEGSNAVDLQDDSGVDSSFYHTSGIDVDSTGYKCIRVDFWFYAVSLSAGHDFFVEYFDGTDWNTVATYVQGQDFNNGQFYNGIVWINESTYTFPNNMQIRFQASFLNNNQDLYIDAVYVTATTQSVGGNGINWTTWSDATNPDTNYPWSWDFDFPDGNGYYQFYSIGSKIGSADETSPINADAICRFKFVVLVINTYDLRNTSGSKLNNATGSLDVNNEYYFQINITDESGWEMINYINITTWYDNGSDNTIYNQSDNLGGNLNMLLQYDNTSGTAVYQMLWPDDEAQIVVTNCTETIINEITRVINISFEPLSQVRWAGGDGAWDTTQDVVNDINSWNFNISVVDSEGKNDSKIDEYGVHKFTSIFPAENWVDVIASPGFSDSSNIVTITYSSNYDFNMTLYFEEDLTNTTWGKTISIANNVDILASADPDDDIITDITFSGFGEANAVDIFNNSGIFSKNDISQTVDVQFDVYIPFGTFGGIYTSRVAVKIIQK